MSSLYPFILGMTTKVYDDMIDIGFELPENVVSILQSLIVFFFTLTALGDFYFSFACLIVSSVNRGFDNPFWKSLFPICFLLTVINLPYAGRWIFLKMILSVIGLIFILLFAYLEDLVFPEEVSKAKIIFRSLLLVGFGLASLVLSYPILPLPSFSIQPLYKTTILLFAHMIVSVATMFHFLDKKPTQTKENETNLSSSFDESTESTQQHLLSRTNALLHSLSYYLRKKIETWIQRLER